MAGQIMRGTTGLHVRSTAGMIVRADDLYPMVPTQQLLYWYRQASVDEPGCASADVWSNSWLLTTLAWSANVRRTSYSSPATTYARQHVRQTTFDGESNVDWTRVKKITKRLDARRAGSNYSCRVTQSINCGSIPGGSTIRDDWDLVIRNPYQYITLEWVIDGVKPASVEYAVCFETESCAWYDYNDTLSIFDEGPIRVVYNLEP